MAVERGGVHRYDLNAQARGQSFQLFGRITPRAGRGDLNCVRNQSCAHTWSISPAVALRLLVFSPLNGRSTGSVIFLFLFVSVARLLPSFARDFLRNFCITTLPFAMRYLATREATCFSTT